MAKRKNRLAPITHERSMVEKIKELEPNITPAEYRALSDGLVDVATAALGIVLDLEAGKAPDQAQLDALAAQTARLSELNTG